MHIVFFHRNIKGGFSINKVIQTVIRTFTDKEEYYVPSIGASLNVMLANMWYVFKRSRSKDVIYHITGDIHYCILPLLNRKTVLTIHDTVGLDFNNLSPLKKFLSKWLWYRLPVLMATKVVCISNETMKRIVQITKRTEDIEVIYNAIDPSLKTSLKDQSVTPYHVLFIGANPNKNLERTVSALEGITCKLTIVGNLDSKQLEFLSKKTVKYEVKSNLTDDEMFREYEQCDIVSFISLFEGFGMPIIEANKVGRPVITSTIPVLREVAGDSAVFVDPDSVAEMHNGFLKLFNDAELRQHCVDAGLENVKRFEPNRIVNQYEEVYNSIV